LRVIPLGKKIRGGGGKKAGEKKESTYSMGPEGASKEAEEVGGGAENVFWALASDACAFTTGWERMWLCTTNLESCWSFIGSTTSLLSHGNYGKVEINYREKRKREKKTNSTKTI
jgi:hypothetical protein